MEGVEILSETIVYVTRYAYWVLFAITGLVAICGFIIGGIGDSTSIKFSIKAGFKGIFFGATVGLLLGAIVVFGNSPRPTTEIDYIEYKVTISDEVGFNEFTEKYEIISQDGKIYTVRERE